MHQIIYALWIEVEAVYKYFNHINHHVKHYRKDPHKNTCSLKPRFQEDPGSRCLPLR